MGWHPPPAAKRPARCSHKIETFRRNTALGTPNHPDAVWGWGRKPSPIETITKTLPIRAAENTTPTPVAIAYQAARRRKADRAGFGSPAATEIQGACWLPSGFSRHPTPDARLA